MLKILRKEIQCDKTVALIKKSLKSPYTENEKTIYLTRGTFQESPLSPLLCNIYLHELDQFIGKQILAFKKEKRKKNIIFDCCKKLKPDLCALAFKKRPNLMFNGLIYIRYADNFIIGVKGSLKDSKEIGKNITNFLRECALKLNLDKLTITNFNRETVTFLDTHILKKHEAKKASKLNYKNDKSYGTKTTSKIIMRAPIKKLLERCILNGFFKKRQSGAIVPTAVGRLVNMSHPDILQFYNQKIKGILAFYSFVDNAKRLRVVIHGLKYSCALTLALKLKIRYRAKVFKKFGS